MPIYRLSEQIIFPNPRDASEDGIIAVGGDLVPERLLLGYKNGIFPWYSKDDPIIWWSPKDRFVLFPEEIKISNSLNKVLKKKIYEVTFNKKFIDVITMCGKTREDTGTWINKEMIEAYTKLHLLGYAHSVESWYNGKLVGGLYGVIIGKIFFGESMFSLMDNASKVAFATFVKKLKSEDFLLIDCQVYTRYLESFGAKNIQREEFLEILGKGINIQISKEM